MGEKNSVRNLLRKEMALDDVESYFRDETNFAIAKALYTLQKGEAWDTINIPLKKLSRVSGIDEAVIRERVKKDDFLPLILDYRKNKSGEWVGLTVLGIDYLIEEKMIDPYHYEVFP